MQEDSDLTLQHFVYAFSQIKPDIVERGRVFTFRHPNESSTFTQGDAYNRNCVMHTFVVLNALTLNVEDQMCEMPPLHRSAIAHAAATWRDHEASFAKMNFSGATIASNNDYYRQVVNNAEQCLRDCYPNSRRCPSFLLDGSGRDSGCGAAWWWAQSKERLFNLAREIDEVFPPGIGESIASRDILLGYLVSNLNHPNKHPTLDSYIQDILAADEHGALLGFMQSMIEKRFDKFKNDHAHIFSPCVAPSGSLPSRSGDMAYWARLRNGYRTEDFPPGSVVGLYQDGVGPPSNTADFVFVVPAQPHVLGPELLPPSPVWAHVKVAFVGMVPVTITSQATLARLQHATRDVVLCFLESAVSSDCNGVCIWNPKSLNHLQHGKIIGRSAVTHTDFTDPERPVFQEVCGVSTQISHHTEVPRLSAVVRQLRNLSNGFFGLAFLVVGVLALIIAAENKGRYVGTMSKYGMENTSRAECVKNVEYLRTLVVDNEFSLAFRYTVSFADLAVPSPQNYVCRDPTVFSEYVDYDGKQWVENGNMTLGYHWSYQLVLFQYQLEFITYIDHLELQKALMMTTIKGNPTCRNPLTRFNYSVLTDGVKHHLDTSPKRSTTEEREVLDKQLRKKVLNNIDYHLIGGLYANKACGIILKIFGVVPPSYFNCGTPLTYFSWNKEK